MPSRANGGAQCSVLGSQLSMAAPSLPGLMVPLGKAMAAHVCTATDWDSHEPPVGQLARPPSSRHLCAGAGSTSHGMAHSKSKGRQDVWVHQVHGVQITLGVAQCPYCAGSHCREATTELCAWRSLTLEPTFLRFCIGGCPGSRLGHQAAGEADCTGTQPASSSCWIDGHVLCKVRWLSRNLVAGASDRPAPPVPPPCSEAAAVTWKCRVVARAPPPSTSHLVSRRQAGETYILRAWDPGPQRPELKVHPTENPGRMWRGSHSGRGTENGLERGGSGIAAGDSLGWASLSPAPTHSQRRLP